jgi:ATP-dependent Clp protease ATP-binding subunit ClpA
MTLARQASQQFNHDYIGTEHMLLGVTQVDAGVAAKVLHQLGIEPEAARAAVEKIVGLGAKPIHMGQLPFTPRAKRVLELSLEEAVGLGHNYIGTEHLLLGLLREGEGIAAQVLRTLGASLDDVRAKVIETLRAEPKTDTRRSDWAYRGAAADVDPHRQMKFAPEEASKRGHAFVGTEHLLLDVILQGGPAAELLASMGATAEAVRDAIGRLRANGQKAPVPPRHATPCATRVLNLSRDEARSRGHAPPRAEHLLVALLDVPECLAVTALTGLGVRIDDLRDRAKKLLDG